MKIGKEYRCYVSYETSFFNQVQRISYAKTNDVVVVTDIDKAYVHVMNKRTNKKFLIPCCIFNNYFN